MKKGFLVLCMVVWGLFLAPHVWATCPPCVGCNDCSLTSTKSSNLIEEKHETGRSDLKNALNKAMAKHRKDFWAGTFFKRQVLPAFKKMQQQKVAGIGMGDTIYTQQKDAEMAERANKQKAELAKKAAEEHALPLTPEGDSVGKMATVMRNVSPEKGENIADVAYASAMGFSNVYASPNAIKTLADQWAENCLPSTPGCRRKNVDDRYKIEYGTQNAAILLTATTIPPERAPEVIRIVQDLCRDESINRLSSHFLTTDKGQQAFLNNRTQTARRSMACHVLAEIVEQKMGASNISPNMDDPNLMALASPNVAEYYGGKEGHPSQAGMQRLLVHSMTDPKAGAALLASTSANAKRHDNSGTMLERRRKKAILDNMEMNNLLTALLVLQEQEKL